MSKVLVTGHKNPDTDSISSAIVYAYLKNQLGVDAQPVRLGEVNKETAYALDYFQVESPVFADENVQQSVEEIILVDHNEEQQSIDDRENFKVIEVIDHHRIANFETMDPLYYRAEPVGCTATILLKLFKEKNVDIPKDLAGLMMSAIISDSLLFKSPTCTDEDIQAARELASIADVDVESYGLEMLKAGADMSGKTPDDLLTMDAKLFEVENYQLEIAQVNTVDVADVLENKDDITKKMDEIIQEKQLSVSLFVITDILNNDSTVVARGEDSGKVECAFDVDLDDDTAVLKGVVSRKKQIAPVLMKEFSTKTKV
ncbi:manganese-dependent inorganic pyrophosphatase [Salicibibacter halophilus]|uniref:Probable manganese-dependent inorganic pyrophosphatase n=1 Tax=Salicibibacter halophilus TaxID=2502791 RepID=A0A514LHZ6_9BACI|nr:manganese-dependent inorganic pyrophosphatase [Salicibibacter halophilus]QDI91462.1 manganese-dependent inorganic pyrophosphatase [Salicibibacter halophilus]